MIDFENEIEILENVLSNLESAIGEIQDTPYHSYMAQGWETDLEEIKSRLEELYDLQDEQWTREMKQQNIEFESGVL